MPQGQDGVVDVSLNPSVLNEEDSSDNKGDSSDNFIPCICHVLSFIR